MTEQPTAAGPGDPGPAAGGSGEDRVIIRNNRKINLDTAEPDQNKPTNEETGTPEETTAPETTDVVEGEVVEEPTATDDAKAPAGKAAPEQPEPAEAAGGKPLGAELEALRAELDERTRDLQRLSAEYANYRKRMDRDRGLIGEQATGTVLTALLPILDDLDRAREHGDLVGPFGTVADQLSAALAKFGLTAFGEKGDPFNPTLHEAVAHQVSAEVTEPTCVDVMRRGYMLGERLLRPAMVAVADPE